MTRISRRDALKQLGVLAGAAAVGPHLLGGCGEDEPAPVVPGKISTIVTMMMENRSYDHYLGARLLLEGRRGDGLLSTMGNAGHDGVLRPVYRESVDCVGDPPHGWESSRLQFGDGQNDGFMKAYQDRHGASAPAHPLGYFGRQELPVHWALADAFTSCDRWFASVMGPTWPNRLYVHTAQSLGMRSNTFPPQGLFDMPTIYDRLDAAGIEWTYYFFDLPAIAILKNIPAARMKRLGIEFFDDAALGKLPPVVFIDPGFGSNDDHPPHHPMMGQQLIASIYAELRNGPQWNEMLFVVTYDEHGGFYDHVAPPKAADERADQGFDQLGFRVPTIIAGPYVKPDHVSSIVHDHTSVMKHIQGMFGLAPLTARDAAATDLSDAIDADRLARGEPYDAPDLPAVEVDESMLDAACGLGGGRRGEPTELELAMDAGLLPRELDARPQTRDALHAVGAALDRHNAGRIRR